MSSTPLSELLKLEPFERAELALAFWDSLTNPERVARVELTPEQKTILERRWAEHLEDPSSALPWDVVSCKVESRE
jgi:putative addiction module component (TIGR02574 family)